MPFHFHPTPDRCRHEHGSIRSITALPCRPEPEDPVRQLYGASSCPVSSQLGICSVRMFETGRTYSRSVFEFEVRGLQRFPFFFAAELSS